MYSDLNAKIQNIENYSNNLLADIMATEDREIKTIVENTNKFVKPLQDFGKQLKAYWEISKHDNKLIGNIRDASEKSNFHPGWIFHFNQGIEILAKRIQKMYQITSSTKNDYKQLALLYLCKMHQVIIDYYAKQISSSKNLSHPAFSNNQNSGKQHLWKNTILYTILENLNIIFYPINMGDDLRLKKDILSLRNLTTMIENTTNLLNSIYPKKLSKLTINLPEEALNDIKMMGDEIYLQRKKDALDAIATKAFEQCKIAKTAPTEKTQYEHYEEALKYYSNWFRENKDYIQLASLDKNSPAVLIEKAIMNRNRGMCFFHQKRYEATHICLMKSRKQSTKITSMLKNGLAYKRAKALLEKIANKEKEIEKEIPEIVKEYYLQEAQSEKSKKVMETFGFFAGLQNPGVPNILQNLVEKFKSGTNIFTNRPTKF